MKIKKTLAGESPSVMTSVTGDIIREEKTEEYLERESDYFCRCWCYNV